MAAMRQAVLWDLDGTLVDSAEYHFESWVDALAAEGRSLTRDQFGASFGQRNDRILAGWLGPEAPAALALRIAEAKEDAYRRFVRERGLDALPGADRWVARLHADGWRQAIASSAPRANVDVVVDALGWRRYFDAIVASEDVRAGKPDPEVFRTAAARLGVPPERCIVVEDAAVGVEAARRGGMKSIGLGVHAATAQPDLAVPSLDALQPDDWTRLRDLPLPRVL
jgi:beta-phosphoglucomutase